VFTEEDGADGGIWQATPDYPSTAYNLSAALGRAGYEGVQNDDRGNLYLAEDTGGPNGSGAAGIPHARQPNSFLFRFKPRNPATLAAGGTLQALQVLDAHGAPIRFGGTSQAAVDADIQSAQTRALRTYGNRFDTRWVDLTLDPATHDANVAAKAAGATPFKRPRTSSSGRARTSRSCSSTRPATRRCCPTPRRRRTPAGTAASSGCARIHARIAGASRCSSPAIRCTPRSTTWRS
jgi:hypothetical protein